MLTTSWVDANERVFLTGAPDGNNVPLRGLNSTRADRYPAGEGAGSIRIASDFISLSQVTTVEKTGGEQQFFTWQYLEDRSGRQRQRPTFKNAKAITLTLDYDPALAWYEALVEADATKDPVVLRATLPNGVVFYYYVYPSFDGDPSMTINENMDNTATFSLISDFTRFEPPSSTAPVNLSAPVISGTPAVDQTLTATSGTWQGADSFTYQWASDGSPIAGITGNSYVLQAGDESAMITVTVTASNAKGSTPATSAPVGPVTA